MKAISAVVFIVCWCAGAFAQQPSQVFPSAKWAWYLVRQGPEGGWPVGGMTKDDITRWIAAHGDWMLGAFPRYGSPTWNLLVDANPNIRFTLYDEWFYADMTVSHPNYNAVSHWSSGWIDGRVVRIENYYLSRGQDPETAFFHVGNDYSWPDANTRFYEEQILSVWRIEGNSLAETGQIDQLYRCEGTSQFALPVTAGGAILFGRPEPYDSLYLEFDPPVQGGQYVLEYVSATARTSSNFLLASGWTPLTIIADGTNGFTRSGVVRFRMPNRWSQWKRCGISTGASNTGMYYWVRLRCTSPPANQPALRGAWVTPYYRYHPTVANVGEAVYLGFPERVASVTLQVLSAGSGGSLAFEYASAVDASGMVTQWATLPSVVDGTTGLSRSGTVSWSLPASPAWVAGKADIGKAPRRYWIRIRVTAPFTTGAVVQGASLPERSLYTQEVYASRYLLIVSGWDPQNDVNGDQYLDDAEFASLRNPNATARWPAQARVVRAGWQGALNYVINWARTELRQVAREHFYDVYLAIPDERVYGLFSDSLVMSVPSPMLSAAVESADVAGWEGNWLEAHRSMRAGGKKVGGNLGTYEVYAPLSQQQAYLDNGFYTHLYNDYVMHEHYPQGRIYQTTETSFRRRLLNISMETGAGLEQVLQFNMAGEALQRIGGGTDAVAWRRFQEHALAFFYLVQHPQRSYLNIWRTAFYGADIEETPIGTMPKPMAYQPTAMLRVDIGQPANEIPVGFTPVTLTYREGGTFPDNIVVGDSATPVLNSNFPKLAGKPVYTTYVFALDSGTLPNRPTTSFTIFARKYTKGLVLLKMTSRTDLQDTGDASATTHPLPGVYRRVNWDGTLGEPITQITLRGMEGAILVDASVASAPLQVTTTVSKLNPHPGEVVRVTVTAVNLSGTEVKSPVITVPVPEAMTYQSGSLRVNGARSPDPPDPRRLTVSVASIPAGGSVRVEFDAMVR